MGEIHIDLPEEVEEILDILYHSGYEGYVVGGAVRDSLLGLTPKDWDMCTSATPDEILEIFSDYKTRYTETSLAHGTITISIYREDFELTTFRSDGQYSDGRHADTVFFSLSINEDLARRDFTINAMAYNHNVGFVDPYSGLEDLEDGVVRCVGDAGTRFSEDALRMMRCIRFSVKYGLHIEDSTFGALAKLHKNISMVAAERIQDEFNKILSCDMDGSDVAFLKILSSVFLPAWSDTERVSHVSNDVPTRLAIGLRHLTYTGILSALDDLKYDRATTKEVYMIVECLKNNPDKMLKPDVKRYMSRFGENIYAKTLEIQDALGMLVSWQEQEFNRVLDNEEPYLVSDLAIDGDDVKGMGLDGIDIGKMLRYLLDVVISQPEVNTWADLMRIAKSGIEYQYYLK